MISENSVLLTTFSSIIKHAGAVLTSLWGNLLLIFSAALAFFEPDWMCYAVVSFSIFADLYWGIRASKKAGKYILSKALRDTVNKVGIYSFCLISVSSAEHIIHDGNMIGIKGLAVYAAACEFVSMSASMLIVFPNMPFLKIFHLQLKGEMESKLGKNRVEEIFPEEFKKD